MTRVLSLMAASFAGILCLALSPAMAQQRGGAALQATDTNGDGKVTKEEFLAARAQQFARRDTNQDGFLDASEFAPRANARPALAGRMLQRLDKNSDGKVSKEEFVDGALPLFQRADSDGNGTIDAKELAGSNPALSGAIIEDGSASQ